jgi:hypothetical protein
MDVWVAISPENATRLVDVFRQFGMADPTVTPELFQQPGKIIRMGIPPMRIEVLTEIDGVCFAQCFAAREVVTLDGQKVNLISLAHLRKKLLSAALTLCTTPTCFMRAYKQKKWREVRPQRPRLAPHLFL